MKYRGYAAATDVLTVREVANYLHVSHSIIYRLLERKEIPAFRVGADWRFNVEEIERWRAELEIRTPGHRN
jgi:excisionase family DNA binding protein